ncbi:hypothetical protein RDT67_11675 [Serratia fonticola]|uniref:Uncharacterized protein n=1 Tax=Serratia fonticola TaxID=47917 RepID=A0AAJ2DAX2_SERFO|nr:hypothetical protein [Serratia fonticola]MDQ9127091.1 hypothetical protein [Serratia fonticola]
MIKIDLKVVYFSAPIITLIIGSFATFLIPKKSTFSCDSDVSYFENEQLKRNLQLSLYLFNDRTGSLDLYGYVNDATKRSTTKIARRLNFNYMEQNGTFFIEHTSTDKYNNDNTDQGKLPEFISSLKQIVHIEKLHSTDYLIYDKASPAFVCRKSSSN